jgi:hypothetical protein
VFGMGLYKQVKAKHCMECGIDDCHGCNIRFGPLYSEHKFMNVRGCEVGVVPFIIHGSETLTAQLTVAFV